MSVLNIKSECTKLLEVFVFNIVCSQLMSFLFSMVCNIIKIIAIALGLDLNWTSDILFYLTT